MSMMVGVGLIGIKKNILTKIYHSGLDDGNYQ